MSEIKPVVAAPADERRRQALSGIRLSEPELLGLARLANRATHFSTSDSDLPSDATEQQREEQKQREEEYRAKEALDQEAALADLRVYNTRSFALLAVIPGEVVVF
jgi:hypothetical protein